MLSHTSITLKPLLADAHETTAGEIDRGHDILPRYTPCRDDARTSRRRAADGPLR